MKGNIILLIWLGAILALSSLFITKVKPNKYERIYDIFVGIIGFGGLVTEIAGLVMYAIL